MILNVRMRRKPDHRSVENRTVCKRRFDGWFDFRSLPFDVRTIVGDTAAALGRAVFRSGLAGSSRHVQVRDARADRRPSVEPFDFRRDPFEFRGL